MVGFAFDTKNGEVEDDTLIFLSQRNMRFMFFFLDPMIVFV